MLVSLRLMLWLERGMYLLMSCDYQVCLRRACLDKRLGKIGLLRGIPIRFFFHKAMNQRFKRNGILGISLDSGWFDNVDEVKREIKSHFESRFQESDYRRLSLRGTFFHSLNNMDGSLLEEPFSLEEIKSDIWDGDGDKSPVQMVLT